MSDALVVVLEDAVAGTLARSPGGSLTFTYDDDYRLRSEATPLSLSLPKQVREHTGSRLEAWLWGLLPDNDAVVRRWARQFHVSASSPFALLSTPVGEDCAGAVTFTSSCSTVEARSNGSPTMRLPSGWATCVPIPPRGSVAPSVRVGLGRHVAIGIIGRRERAGVRIGQPSQQTGRRVVGVGATVTSQQPLGGRDTIVVAHAGKS